MKKLLFTLMALAPLALFAQSNWQLDKSHASVKFTVKHLVISEVEGKFKTFDGSFTAAKPDFTDARISFAVDVNSIDTDNEKRDSHLKGDDFFSAEKYPKMTFRSVSLKKVKGNDYVLEGDLTIRDVTKRVKFNVTNGGTIKDPWGNTRTGFKATATIDRTAFGLKWSGTTEAGGLVVDNNVNIVLNLEFVQAKA